MNSHMKLLYSHDKNVLKGGEQIKLGNGFPNLVINIYNTEKKQYQYNVGYHPRIKPQYLSIQNRYPSLYNSAK